MTLVPAARPVVVLASRVRTEEKQLLAALDRRSVRYVQFDTRRMQADIMVDAVARYSLALCREIAHTRALYASRLLEAVGTPTVNTARVIEICGDKLLTSLELARARLPTPRTAVALTPEASLRAMKRIGYPVVVKPLTGSWGRLAAIVRDDETAQTVIEHRAALPSPQQNIVYVQELIDKPGRDIRVVVVGDRVLGATFRRSRDWRTNVARGAVSAPCPVTVELESLALASARAVGGGVLGVDILEDGNGQLLVLEVNHNVEFRGFQAAHQGRIDVAGAIVDHLLTQVPRQ